MLDEKTSKFAVVRTAFHGGGVVKFTNSIAVAERIERVVKKHNSDCTCGCCEIVAVNKTGRKELYEHYKSEPWCSSINDITMYNELTTYKSELPYYTICR